MSSPENGDSSTCSQKNASIITLCLTRSIFSAINQLIMMGTRLMLTSSLQHPVAPSRISELKLTTKRHLIKTDALSEHVDIKLWGCADSKNIQPSRVLSVVLSQILEQSWSHINKTNDPMMVKAPKTPDPTFAVIHLDSFIPWTSPAL